MSAVAYERRPLEEAALLNPAFVATLLSAAAADFEAKSGAPLPWPVAFLIAPLVLQADLRSALPRSTRAYFVNWISANAYARAEAGPRARAFAPYTREAIDFGLRHGLLARVDAALRGTLQPTATERRFSREAAECVNRAAFLGRWFAPYERDVAQLYAFLGIAP